MSLSPGLALTRSAPAHPARNLHWTATMLRYLGIPFKGSGRNFFLDNEGELHYLLHDLRALGRKEKARLHPDKGGDTAAFAHFSQAHDRVVARFERILGLRSPIEIEAERQREKEADREKLHQRWVSLTPAQRRAKYDRENAYKRQRTAAALVARASSLRVSKTPSPIDLSRLAEATEPASPSKSESRH